MSFHRKVVAALFSGLLPFTSGMSQTQRTERPQDEQNVVITTGEVSLDVVVRDKGGRLIKNLSATDFEVYEDGVRQDVELVPGAGEAAAAVTEAPDKQKSSGNGAGKIAEISRTNLSALAIVFDRLKPEARGLARQAALAYAAQNLRANDYVGVYAIDQSLIPVQQFTADLPSVRAAVERASAMNSSTYNLGVEMDRFKTRGSVAQTAFGGQAGIDREGPVIGGPAAPAGAGSDPVTAIMGNMVSRSLEVFERLEREQQGHATLNSLIAVASAMNRLPGRKAIIFFSEGLALPPAVDGGFRSLVGTANRSNVSIYPIDAAGLRGESATAETRRQVNTLSAGLEIKRDGVDTGSGAPLTRDLERNEDLLRFNPHSGLGQLANQTSGFLISETNDLKDGLRRIDEDLRGYYLLRYSPKNQNFDGRYRRLEVKAKRGATVQSREGYYALNGSYASPVLAHEAPALARLKAKDAAAGAFPLRVAGLSFPEPARPGLATIMVEAPAGAFTYAVDESKKTYQTNFSVVVLIKDAAGRVVSKLSRHYLSDQPVARLEAAKRGEILFYREAELGPGEYTVEAVAYDAPTGRAGVRTSRLKVPEAGGAKLNLSSLVIVKRAEQLAAAERDPKHPLHAGEVLLYPNLHEPVRRSASKQLPFFFTVYGAGALAPAPNLVIEIRHNDRALGSISGALPAPDAEGRVQYANALPLEKFAPGDYELSVTVKGREGALTRSEKFTVAP